MNNIEVNDLIHYFETRLRQKNEYGVSAFAGEGPKYPMAVVYLGTEAAKAHGELFQRLSRIWPPFKNEICFFEALLSDEQEELKFFSMGEEKPGEELTKDSMNARVSGLFGVDTHFGDFSRMMVFYVMDTTAVTTAGEFDKWVQAIGTARMRLMAENQMSLLTVFLNEKFEHKENAGNIKEEIGRMFYGEDAKERVVNSIFLLSNKRNDSALLNDWKLCYRILADIIVLSNNHDAQIASAMFRSTVKTVGYALEEKPSKKIAQVVIANLIKQLDDYRIKADGPALLADEELPKRLGIGNSGLLEILDRYADERLIPMLPSEEELEYFPRSFKDDTRAAKNYSAEEFDNMTMGAWSCYLKNLVSRANTKVSGSGQQMEQWKREYQEFLAGQFTADELTILEHNRDAIKRMFQNVQKPASGGEVLFSAKAMLKYHMSSNESLTDCFVDALSEEASDAEKFVNAWSSLTRSLGGMFGVHDDSLRDFYEKRARVFFDRHGSELKQQFNRLQNVSSLWGFLTQTIDQMLNSDPIYSEPFEDELQERLEAAANPMDSRSYIRTHLTGNEVKTYLHVSFALERPVLTAMLLKQGTPLHMNLKENLDSNICYYDTGCGDTAETLAVYQVDQSNLLTGAC